MLPSRTTAARVRLSPSRAVEKEKGGSRCFGTNQESPSALFYGIGLVDVARFNP